MPNGNSSSRRRVSKDSWMSTTEGGYIRASLSLYSFRFLQSHTDVFFFLIYYLAGKTFSSPRPNPTPASVSSVSPQTTVFSAVSPSLTNLKPLPVSHPCTTGMSTLVRMIVVLGLPLLLLLLRGLQLLGHKRKTSHRLWTSSRMEIVLI